MVLSFRRAFLKPLAAARYRIHRYPRARMERFGRERGEMPIFRKHAGCLVRIGILLGILVPSLVAQATARHAGQDVRTLDLLSHPESDVLASARAAFREGDIVRIVGGRPEDLQRLLGTGGAILSNSHPNSASNPFNALQDLNATAPIYQVVAARATRTG